MNQPLLYELRRAARAIERARQALAENANQGERAVAALIDALKLPNTPLCASETAKTGVLVENAVTCRICGSPADRYAWGYQCQANPGHMGDLNVGIFSDLSFPTAEVWVAPVGQFVDAEFYLLDSTLIQMTADERSQREQFLRAGKGRMGQRYRWQELTQIAQLKGDRS